MSSTLQQAVLKLSHELHARGWVANHDGNVSVRYADGVRYMATCTAMSKAALRAQHLVTVDADGKVLSGSRKIFGEWHLHVATYKARPDVKIVVHAHPPYATALGLARRALGVPAMPEVVVSLGKNIPLVGYAMPKSASQDQELAAALTTGDADAVLIAGNGVLTVGVDFEQVLLRMELVEHYAKVFTLAAGLGGVTPLPDADVAKLLEARTRAGLGRAGRALGVLQ